MLQVGKVSWFSLVEKLHTTFIIRRSSSFLFPFSVYLPACPFVQMFAQMCIFNLAFSPCLTCNLLPLICSEKRDTKPVARTNQVRPRDAQAKKHQSATLPASSKPAGGTASATRHKDGASGAKKTAKTTGKTGSSAQAKANPRSTNNTSHGTGKFS